MSDYLIDKFDNPFAKSITGTLWDIGKRFIGSSFEVLKDKKQAAKATKKYAEKYESRYGLLKLLGMPKGVSLESVYTPVRFLDELSIRQFESLETLEEVYRDNETRKLQIGKCQSQDGITVANETQYLMVLGNPGAGKSTFLRRMGLEALKGNAGRFKHNCIPVMLELKQFNTSTIDLVGAIAEEFTHFGFPPSRDFAIKALEQGKLLVLLDGLDEVPKGFSTTVMDAIDNLVTHYEQNRFIASCRIAAYRSNFKHNFQVIELADFDDKQIKQFITNWFSSELDKQTKTAEKCWETLNQENNKAAKELAQTPLLLTFLCLVYNRKQSFPPTRSRLYNKALDILLEEWAAEKRIQQEEIYQGLNTDLEKVMLAEIAYEGFAQDQLFFQKQQLVDHIKDFLADTVDNPKYLDGQKILKAIAAQQGILVERAEDIYSFSHLTLQEYLTAQYISQQDDRIEELVTKHLTDKRWREVFLLVAGLKDNAVELLKLMETATRQYINNPKLQNLLVWVEQVTDSTPRDLKPVGKRAIALELAKAVALKLDLDIAEAIAKAKDFSKVKDFSHVNIYLLAKAIKLNFHPDIVIATAIAKAINIAAVIDGLIDYTQVSQKFQIYKNVNFTEINATLEKLKKQIPNCKEEKKVCQIFNNRLYQTFSNKLRQIWLEAFHLTPEMIDLSESELEALDNYFYANLLMVQCKKAAVRVSKETWQGIESRMLLPVDRNKSE